MSTTSGSFFLIAQAGFLPCCKLLTASTSHWCRKLAWNTSRGT